jgi:hypothetical protein
MNAWDEKLISTSVVWMRVTHHLTFSRFQISFCQSRIDAQLNACTCTERGLRDRGR